MAILDFSGFVAPSDSRHGGDTNGGPVGGALRDRTSHGLQCRGWISTGRLQCSSSLGLVMVSLHIMLLDHLVIQKMVMVSGQGR